MTRRIKALIQAADAAGWSEKGACLAAIVIVCVRSESRASVDD
jgi:hypothetical protein